MCLYTSQSRSSSVFLLLLSPLLMTWAGCPVRQFTIHWVLFCFLFFKLLKKKKKKVPRLNFQERCMFCLALFLNYQICYQRNALCLQYSSCPLDGNKAARFKVPQPKNNVKTMCSEKCCKRDGANSSRWVVFMVQVLWLISVGFRLIKLLLLLLFCPSQFSNMFHS